MQEYDFFGAGQRSAQDGFEETAKRAEEIGREYGSKAKSQFETGVAAATPEYEKYNEMIDSIPFASEKDFDINKHI